VTAVLLPTKDGFTALELCRKHYREAGLDVQPTGPARSLMIEIH
jgi:hypothetical protein